MLAENRDAADLHRTDLEHCVHPWTDFSDWLRSGSTTMVRGDGAYVWDARGNRFIDGIGGLWFANVGYGRRELIDAAARQLGALPQYSYFANLANPPATELAGRILESLRQRRVLAGRIGVHLNILKLRPPMVFDRETAVT